jgi:hypothetical protein
MLGSMPRPLVTVRPISDAEAAVLERALAIAATDESAPAMMGQVRSLQVVGRCGCGCASVDFRSLAKGQIARIVADAMATAPNGESLGLIVWALDNELSALEVYSYSDDPAPLPEVASIVGYDGSNAA